MGTSLEKRGVLGVVPFTGLTVARIICTRAKRLTPIQNSVQIKGGWRKWVLGLWMETAQGDNSQNNPVWNTQVLSTAS